MVLFFIIILLSFGKLLTGTNKLWVGDSSNNPKEIQFLSDDSSTSDSTFTPLMNISLKTRNVLLTKNGTYGYINLTSENITIDQIAYIVLIMEMTEYDFVIFVSKTLCFRYYIPYASNDYYGRWMPESKLLSYDSGKLTIPYTYSDIIMTYIIYQ